MILADLGVSVARCVGIEETSTGPAAGARLATLSPRHEPPVAPRGIPRMVRIAHRGPDARLLRDFALRPRNAARDMDGPGDTTGARPGQRRHGRRPVRVVGTSGPGPIARRGGLGGDL